MRYLFFVCHIFFITLPCFSQIIFPPDITEIDDFQFENKSINGEIIIPDTVISIGESSFARNDINSVKLPISLSNISKLAFAYNKITALLIPSDLVSIERFAFYSNELTKVELPQGLLSINDSAFARNNIYEILLPDTLRTIGRSAFDGNQIDKIDIPHSVHTIGAFAFFGNNIKEIVISSSIRDLGYSTFANNQISNLLIEDGIKVIPGKCFAENKIEKIKIPYSVYRIGEFAFQNNRLTSISIPDICIVESGAFDGNKITSIIIEGGDIRYKEVSGVDENNEKYITFGDYGITFNDFFLWNKKRAGIYTYDIDDGWSFQYSISNLPFSEVLKKNIWNILGSTIGIFGIIIGIIALVNRKTRKPVYSKSDEYDIVDRMEEGNNLKLIWNNNEINNIRVVNISFWNRGKKIIRKNDISDTEPIEIFCINENVRILKYFISKISRASIILNIVNDKNYLKININNNEALEYKDGFEIVIYYTRGNDEINKAINDDWRIKGRIHEVKSIKDIGKISIMRKMMNNLFYLLPFYLIGAVIGLAGIFGAYSFLDKLGVSDNIQVFIITPVFLIIYLIIYSIPKKHDRTYKIPKWSRNNQ